jgi:Mlc titration factor MtfA (ptsG expression regulator)
MRWLFEKWRRYRASKLKWQEHEPWFQAVVYRVPGLSRLANPEKANLRQLVKEFLVDKKIYGAGGLEIDLGLKIKIATLACWPALHLGFSALEGFSSVVVYPEGFRAMRSTVDVQTGLVTEYEQEMAGETSQHGPVVLSKDDIERGLAGFGRIGNVVIHEIAHKIDALGGTINGVPPLHPNMSVQTFSNSLSAAFEALKLDVAYGTAQIDSYAAHSPPEFFAVASEYYFLAPEHLNAIYPSVFSQLDAFYRHTA